MCVILTKKDGAQEKRKTPPDAREERASGNSWKSERTPKTTRKKNGVEYVGREYAQRTKNKVLQTITKEKKGQMPKMATCRLENNPPKKKGMHDVPPPTPERNNVRRGRAVVLQRTKNMSTLILLRIENKEIREEKAETSSRCQTLQVVYPPKIQWQVQLLVCDRPSKIGNIRHTHAFCAVLLLRTRRTLRTKPSNKCSWSFGYELNFPITLACRSLACRCRQDDARSFALCGSWCGVSTWCSCTGATRSHTAQGCLTSPRTVREHA